MTRSRWFLGLWSSYWVLLFASTHTPMPGWPSWAPEPSDKTLHVAAFFILAFVGWLALSARFGPGYWQASGWFVVAAIYGACDEVTQPLFGRNCSILDWFADILGVVMAITVIEIGRGLHHRMTPQPA